MIPGNRASEATLRQEIKRLKSELEKAEAEIMELNQTFDLRWKADIRAIKQWRKAHPGNELVMPDHVDLVLWLSKLLEGRE